MSEIVILKYRPIRTISGTPTDYFILLTFLPACINSECSACHDIPVASTSHSSFLRRGEDVTIMSSATL